MLLKNRLHIINNEHRNNHIIKNEHRNNHIINNEHRNNHIINNEHRNNHITKTNYDAGVENRAVHFDFLWQQIPRTVNPRVDATQAASLHRLVGVARGLIRSNRSNRVKTSAAYMTKTVRF